MNKGSAGEQFAADTLAKMGYNIIARNFHSRYGEIDIIASKDDIICFVEVKTRRLNPMVSGALAVGKTKQSKIIKTALMYLQENTSIQLQPRFDVFSIEYSGSMTDKQLSYDYIEGAFYSESYI